MKNKRKFRCGRKACRRIYILAKHPSAYSPTKRCDCGGRLGDYSADRRRNRGRVCLCDAVHWPHKKGSIVWCQHHPTGPTEQDFIDRYGP